MARMKFYENPSDRSRVVPHTHTDGRKYVGMRWTIVAFCNCFANTPENSPFVPHNISVCFV